MTEPGRGRPQTDWTPYYAPIIRALWLQGAGAVAGHLCLMTPHHSAKVPVPVRQLAAAGPGPGAAVWCYMSVPSRQRRGVRQEAATPERGTDGRVGQSREVVCLCADGDDEWAHLGHQMLL